MITAETLLVLAVLCDPTPHPGYGWRVDAELAAHDRAMETLGTTDSPQEWQAANMARIAAEARLARLLDVQPQPAPALDYDDGLARFFA